jgi:hypothetical protein
LHVAPGDYRAAAIEGELSGRTSGEDRCAALQARQRNDCRADDPSPSRHPKLVEDL